jgi:prepilin-type N-terminal cleavage/methylation domain-containing protein
MQAKQRGFTLVEIAIVLVIIGLLLGGILKGQEMITQAKIKNVVADFSGVSAAYYGYQDRYRAIPGDDPNAQSRWTTAPAAVNGTGDGIVGGTYKTTDDAQESRKWWDHLRRAGFVSGSGYNQPFNAVAGIIGIQTGIPGTPITAAMGGITSLMVCSTNLPDKIAIAVDTQMDDGAPNKGQVRGDVQSGPNPDLDNTVPSAYEETGTNTYVICRAM